MRPRSSDGEKQMARVKRKIRHWFKRMMDSPIAKYKEVAGRMHHA